jgi:hypothetical protein
MGATMEDEPRIHHYGIVRLVVFVTTSLGSQGFIGPITAKSSGESE